MKKFISQRDLNQIEQVWLDPSTEAELPIECLEEALEITLENEHI